MNTPTDYNKTKHIGIAFCTFLCMMLIQLTIGLINWNMSLIFLINLINIILDIIIVASILYIGFSKKIKSRLTTKIGATLHSLYYLYWIIAICLYIIGDPLVYYTYPIIICSSLIFICSFLLFIWGMDIWRPAKIVLSLLLLTSLVDIVAKCSWMNIMEQGLIDDYVSNYNKIQNVIIAIDIISIFTSLLLVIFRWRKEYSLLQSKQRITNYNTKFPIPTHSPMANSPKIVTKIPHKAPQQDS